MTAGADPAALNAALSGLERDGEETVVTRSLQRIVDACVAILPVAGCGLMLADDESDLRYVITSNKPARALETAQLATGSGPCVDAFVRATTVSTPDVTDDPRWPAMHEPMTAGDVRAVAGAPIRLSNLCVGSIDVYRTTVGPWSDDELDGLNRFAQIVDTMLATVVSASKADAVATQLSQALETRVVVERAVGYLMARDRAGVTEAFQTLRTAARSQRRKVSEVAVELLATGQLPERRHL